MTTSFSRSARQRFATFVLGLSLLGIFPICTVSAEVSAYLKIDGIPGEHAVPPHDGWIRIHSVGLDITRPISIDSIGRPALGKLAVSDFVVTKSLDKASPLIFGKAVTGSAIANVEIDLTRMIGGQEKTYMKYVLTNVHVSRLSTAGTDQLSESLGLFFEEIQVTYTPFGPNGEPGTPITVSYNVLDDTTN